MLSNPHIGERERYEYDGKNSNSERDHLLYFDIENIFNMWQSFIDVNSSTTQECNMRYHLFRIISLISNITFVSSPCIVLTIVEFLIFKIRINSDSISPHTRTSYFLVRGKTTNQLSCVGFKNTWKNKKKIKGTTITTWQIAILFKCLFVHSFYKSKPT